MRTVPYLRLIAIPLLSLLTPPTASAGMLGRRNADPCASEANAIVYAPNPTEARASVRAWLRCHERQDHPPTDLDVQLNRLLRANPYDAVERDAVQLSREFSDPGLLRELPSDPEQTREYVLILRDQALFARASGDDELSKAAEDRAARLSRLQALVDLTQAQ